MFGIMRVSALWPFGPRRGRMEACPFKQRRIVSMVDEGCSYAVIRRRMRVGNTEIDVALRQSLN